MGDRVVYVYLYAHTRSLALSLAFPAIEDDAIRADLFRCSQCGQLERDSIGLRFLLLLAAASRAWEGVVVNNAFSSLHTPPCTMRSRCAGAAALPTL